MWKYVSLFVLLALCVLLTACGRNRDDEDNVDTDPQEEYQNGQITGPVVFGETASLNIAALQWEAYFLNSAAERLTNELAEAGINFEMNLSLYTIHTAEDFEYYLINIQTKLAAGQGYDIFFHQGVQLPIQGLISGGFLADINLLIDQDPSVSRQDYFTNILEAMEIDGGLYTFPLSFNHEFIGINNRLPEEIISRFAGYSSISISQLAAIYNDLQAAHPEFEDLAAGFRIRSGAALVDMLGQHINWNSGTIQIEAEPLSDFLNKMCTAFAGNTRNGAFFEDVTFSNPQGSEMTALLADRFVFSSHSFNLDPVNALLEFHNPYFVHYIPLASEDGRLAVWDAASNMYSISSTANGPLAWAFLRTLVEARSESFRRESSMEIPIARGLFHSQTEDALRSALDEPSTMPFIGQGDLAQEERIIIEAIQRLEGYLAMPVSCLRARMLLPVDDILEPFLQLLSEEITPLSAANEIIESVSEWLVYGDALYIDADIVEQLEAQAQVEAEREDLPVRSLSILATNEYGNVIRQAAADINQAWAEQGLEHSFELNLTTYTWENWESVSARLHTMLMAGDGYDILFADWFMPYRTFAESGFFTDIYPLIEQCPNTSLDDFYTNVLEAFEINGRLYGFPLSFGFEWVGINANMPQPFIDRFAQYDRISISSMMAIFNDLRAEHGDEVGRRQIGSQFSVGHPGVALPHVMGSFIDFDNRTANFTDDGFITFLETFRVTFDGGLGFDDWITRTGSNMWDASGLRDMAREYVFLFEFAGINPLNALFTPENPIFAHFIPVSDENGHLRVNHLDGAFGNPVWATLYFHARGDGPLAWEFTQHLINAFMYPRGGAATNQWGGVANWGRGSFAVPIRRDGFYSQITRAIDYALNYNHQPFVNMPDNQEQAIADAINRLAMYIHEPMVIPPTIPGAIQDLNIADIEDFKLGIITAQAAAQNIQNRMFLWLIE